MGALGALFELGVDVEGHLGVGVADLVHDPFDVEVVGQQRDRDVGPPQRVRRDVGQRWQPARDQPAGRFSGGDADDLAHALAAHPPASEVGDRVGVRVDGASGAAQAVEVLDERLDEVGALAARLLQGVTSSLSLVSKAAGALGDVFELLGVRLEAVSAAVNQLLRLALQALEIHGTSLVRVCRRAL